MILFHAELAVSELKDQLYFYNISTIKGHKQIVYLIEFQFMSWARNENAYKVSSIFNDSGFRKGEGRSSTYLQIQDRRDRKLNVQNKCPKGLICIAKLHCVRTRSLRWYKPLSVDKNCHVWQLGYLGSTTTKNVKALVFVCTDCYNKH